MRHLVGAVLAAMAVAVAAQGQQKAAEEVSYKTRLAQLARMTPAEIAWGRESRHREGIAVMDPPHFTPDRDRVEVVVFTRYTSEMWRASERLTRAWQASLPDAVVVTRAPRGPVGSAKPALKRAWSLQRRLYLAAERLGAGGAANEVLGRMVRTNPYGFKRADRRAWLARRIGVELAVLDRWAASPEVARDARVVGTIRASRVWAEEAMSLLTYRWALYPKFLIDGTYFVHAATVGHPRKAYRIANRLIREALERGRAPGVPIDNVTLTDWMAPRSGEVFHRERFGRTFGYKGVYSADRREFWDLDANGGVRHVHRLTGEGRDAYFATKLRTGRRYPHVWRFARQYVSYAGADGRPQRYGAFLLTDWLSAPDTLWVGLPFKGREVAMAFTPDGRVEARNDAGSLFGTWWLEAGNLNVSFGELGIESWPWQEAAAHVDFEVPPRSLTPWRVEQSEKKRDWSAAGDGK